MSIQNGRYVQTHGRNGRLERNRSGDDESIRIMPALRCEEESASPSLKGVRHVGNKKLILYIHLCENERE